MTFLIEFFKIQFLNSTQYKTYAQQYSKAKAGGIRCVYAWMSGTGVLGVATDVGEGIVIDYGKRKFAAVCINAGAYILSPAVVVFTNASKIVTISKIIHSSAAFCEVVSILLWPIDCFTTQHLIMI